MADVMHGSRLALPVSLELRALPSRAMAYASPLIALALTLVFGLLLFALLGKDPVAGVRVFLIEPLATKRAIGEVLLKTVPLVLCALGLSVCYRANVWNIGAEGQLIVGGIFAAATIIHFDTPTPAIPAAPRCCSPSWPGWPAACCGRASPPCCATASMPTRSWSR